MAELTPEQVAATAKLRAWALTPEGRARVGLNGPTPFRSCVAFYTGKVPHRMIDGWCARLVHAATGHWPGDQHQGHGDHHPG